MGVLEVRTAVALERECLLPCKDHVLFSVLIEDAINKRTNPDNFRKFLSLGPFNLGCLLSNQRICPQYRLIERLLKLDNIPLPSAHGFIRKTHPPNHHVFQFWQIPTELPYGGEELLKVELLSNIHNVHH